ncbi:MAG TPA: hypothetical protein VGM88_31945 [Kofleriaceae bacterium]|jgi:hypothetical protein
MSDLEPASARSTRGAKIQRDKLRSQLLTNIHCDSSALADYIILTDEKAANEVCDLFSKAQTRDARLIALRIKKQYGEVGAIERAILKGAWFERAKSSAPAAVQFIFRGVPWQALITLAAVWIFTNMCHAPRLHIATASWTMPSSAFSDKEKVDIENSLAALWTSNFAMDSMRDLNPLCTQELSDMKPSAHCLHDLISRMDRISTSEHGELATIGLIEKALRTWCPSHPGLLAPDNTRLLYDSDFITSALYPTIDSKDSTKSCTGPEIAYRRQFAETRITQYREMVRNIFNRSQYLANMFRAHLSDSQRKFVEVAIQNQGESSATLNLRGVELQTFANKSCQSVHLVQLDQYSGEPQSTQPNERVTIAAGTTAIVQLEVNCTNISDLPLFWVLVSGKSDQLAFTLPERSLH